MSNGKRKFRPIVLVIFCLSFVVCEDSMASDIKIIEGDKKEGRAIADRIADVRGEIPIFESKTV